MITRMQIKKRVMRIPAQAIHSSFLLLPFIVFTCSVVVAGDKWDPNSCPKNLSTYANCRVRVSAIFESAAHKCNGRSDYSFSIQVNNVIPAVSGVESVGVNNSDSVCMISGYIENPKVSYRHVTFIAQYIAVPIDPSSVNCDDSILVKDGIGSPSFSNVSKTCEGIYFKWIGPDLLPGFEVSKFHLYILGTNITIETVDTSILIPYDDLEYHKEYNISLSASYCAGEGNAIFETFFTAIAPKVDAKVDVAVHIQNTEVANIKFTAKVHDAECAVSYPTKVHVNITCTKKEPHWEAVSIGDDGTIEVNIDLPVDRVCNGILTWKNQFHTVQPSLSKTLFTTNQLQKCNFWVYEGEILVACYYAKGSTLKGCRGVATHQSTGYNYTNDFIAQFGGGDIPVMCAGVYNVTCYGLKNGSANSVTGYSGTLYNTILTVRSGSSCMHETLVPSNSLHTTSTLMYSAAGITSSAIVAPPTNNHIEAKIIEITVPVFVICIIIIIALSIVSVIFIVLYIITRKKIPTLNRPGTGEAREMVSLRPSGLDEKSPTEKVPVKTVKVATRKPESESRPLLDPSITDTDLGDHRIGEQRTDKDTADEHLHSGDRSNVDYREELEKDDVENIGNDEPECPDLSHNLIHTAIEQNKGDEPKNTKEEDETQYSVNTEENSEIEHIKTNIPIPSEPIEETNRNTSAEMSNEGGK